MHSLHHSHQQTSLTRLTIQKRAHLNYQAKLIMIITNIENIDAPCSSFGEFKRRMEALKPMEKRTAQSFLDRGITDKYVWPKNNETAAETLTRKKENTKILDAAKKRKSTNQENPEVRQQRLEAMAEHNIQVRNQENPEVRQ